MLKLRSPAAAAGLIALEAIGIAIAAATTVGVYIAWRLQTGPVDIGFIRPVAIRAIERALPAGSSAQIGALRLERSAARGELVIVASGIRIDGARKTLSGRIDRVEGAVRVADVVGGFIGPRTVRIVSPRLELTQGTEKQSDGRPTRSVAETIRAFMRARADSSGAAHGPARIEVTDAAILFSDSRNGQSWRAQDGHAVFVASAEGYEARARSVFQTTGGPARLTATGLLDGKTGAGRMEIRFDKAPVGDLLSLAFGADAGGLSAPVTGVVSVAVGADGEVEAAQFDVAAGPGEVRLGQMRAAVNAFEARGGYDPAAGAFPGVTARFDAGGLSGELAGDVRLRRNETGTGLQSVDFSLRSDRLIVAPPDLFEAPLETKDLAIEGAYDFIARSLTLREIRAGLLDVVMRGTANVAFATGEARMSPGIAARIDMDGALDPARIVRGWPLGAAEGVRTFIAERIPAARVANLKFRIDVPPGALGPGAALADEALDLSFDIADATTIYTPGMTPLTGASGAARLTGNRFVIKDVRARVGGVELFDGVIDFTQLAPRGQPVNYTFSARGPVRAMLSVLDEKPLSLIRPTGFDPAQFGGEAVARVTITRPNLRDVDRGAYGYSGKADFSGASVSEFYRGIDLAAARGEITLESRRMRLVAEAELGDAPIRIDWRQNFYRNDGPSAFAVAGTIDASTGDVFGVPTRQMLRGPVDFTAEAFGELGAVRRMTLAVDLQRAGVTLDQLGWRKPPGAAARISGEARFTADAIDLTSITATGEGIDVSGAFRLSGEGALLSAEFPRVFLEDASDFAFTIRRDDAGGMDAELTGRLLSVGPMIEKAVAAPARERTPPPGEALHVAGRLDAVILRGGARFSDASLDIRRQGDRLVSLDLSARAPNGTPVALMLAETGAANGGQRIDGRSGDIGALLAGVFGVTSIRGGEGVMALDLPPSEAGPGGAIEGRVEARRLKVVKAPLLARVFAAGSFDGLANLVNGEGIDLSRAEMRFAIREGAVAVSEARASGPSVGVTGSGRIGAGPDGAVALSGAIAPAYGVNSILGRTPVIGELFVNREGEGVVALAYEVSGPISTPTVTVNPLSALTPGVFRRMFEAGRAEGDAASPTKE